MHSDLPLVVETWLLHLSFPIGWFCSSTKGWASLSVCFIFTDFRALEGQHSPEKHKDFLIISWCGWSWSLKVKEVYWSQRVSILLNVNVMASKSWTSQIEFIRASVNLLQLQNKHKVFQTSNSSNVTDIHLLLHCNPRNLDLVLQLCLSQKYYSPGLFVCCVSIFLGLLILQAEGLEQMHHTAVLLELSPPYWNVSRDMMFTFPADVVEGSERVTVTAVGT